MTTTYRDEVRGGTQGQAGVEQRVGPFEEIKPLLFATLMSERREHGGIQPLVLAALMSQRKEQEGIQPLVLAAMMAQRRGQE